MITYLPFFEKILNGQGSRIKGQVAQAAGISGPESALQIMGAPWIFGEFHGTPILNLKI